MGLSFRNGSRPKLIVELEDKDSKALENISDVIESVSLVWDIDSDTKFSATANIAGVDPTGWMFRNARFSYEQWWSNSAISEKDIGSTGENGVERETNFMIAYVSAVSGDYENGVWSGSLTFSSFIANLQKDIIGCESFKDLGAGANATTTSAWQWFGDKDSSAVSVSVKDEYFRRSDKKIDVMKLCMGPGGENIITINSQGRALLKAAPTKKSPHIKVKTDGNSLVFPGISKKVDSSDVVNKAVVYARGKTTADDVKMRGGVKAVLDKGNKYSYEKTGRYVTVSEEIPTSELITLKQAQSRAKSLLRNSTSKGKTEIAFRSMKLDVNIGDPVQLEYDGMTFDGMCCRKELTMDASSGCAPIQATTIRMW